MWFKYKTPTFCSKLWTDCVLGPSRKFSTHCFPGGSKISRGGVIIEEVDKDQLQFSKGHPLLKLTRHKGDQEFHWVKHFCCPPFFKKLDQWSYSNPHPNWKKLIDSVLSFEGNIQTIYIVFALNYTADDKLFFEKNIWFLLGVEIWKKHSIPLKPLILIQMLKIRKLGCGGYTGLDGYWVLI